MTCLASCRSEVRPACWEVVGNGHRKGDPASHGLGQKCQSVTERFLWLEASKRCLRGRHGRVVEGLREKAPSCHGCLMGEAQL